MKLTDAVGFGVALSFGLWWILLPKSVNRFYLWFHQKNPKFAHPSPLYGVRLAGLLWCGLVAVVMWAVFAR